MLKIKDNVNLKELEKFGFYKGLDDACHKCYLKDLDYLDYIAIYEDKKIYFDIEDFCGSDWNKYCKSLIQDLINAELVEKVSDKNDK